MSPFEVYHFRVLKRIKVLTTSGRHACGFPQKKALLALKKQSSTSQTNQGGLKRSKWAFVLLARRREGCTRSFEFAPAESGFCVFDTQNALGFS